MPRIDFHVNVADPLSYGCRLLRKIYRSRQRVVLCCDDPDWTAQLDAALWRLTPTDFIPHVLASDPLASQTPIVLTPAAEVPEGAFDVLVNAGLTLAEGFERCPRVIEIVGLPEPQRVAGRARWRRYRELGHAPTSHDLQPSA